ncbi:hypothetical protein KAU45_05295 [bacterium]|nr:hypothetical protein [bacterium]
MQLVEKLLTVMRTQGASDLHVLVGYPPHMRLDGKLIPTSLEPFSRETANSFTGIFLSVHAGARLDETGQVDLGYELEGHGRFRVNVYRTAEGLACAIRAIRHIITLEDPIEFRHEHGRSLVTQRELGADFTDTATAVRGACWRPRS